MIQTILTEDVQKSMIPGVREGQMEANETPERKAVSPGELSLIIL